MKKQDTYLGRDRTGKRSVEARIAALTTAMEAVGDDSWTNDAEEYEAGLDLHFRLKRERERLRKDLPIQAQFHHPQFKHFHNPRWNVFPKA